VSRSLRALEIASHIVSIDLMEHHISVVINLGETPLPQYPTVSTRLALQPSPSGHPLLLSSNERVS